ncbi:MAG: hypothetical protein FJ276_29030 [Planctomycetes bacterium]|nr:hypothetical protein [Planctomycetota bacterium]
MLHPELVPAALEAIAGAQLTSAAAHALWNLYAAARKQQLECDFCGILTATEDPALKNLLVDIDERARRKANDATEDAEDRLHGLVRDFHFQQQSAAQRQALAALGNRGYDEKEELAVLERIIQQERDRQGISAPTDG